MFAKKHRQLWGMQAVVAGPLVVDQSARTSRNLKTANSVTHPWVRIPSHCHVLAFAQKVQSGLDKLDFSQRQELMRLLIEDVTCTREGVQVRTIIPPVPLRLLS